MANPHPMHQFLKNSMKNKMSIREVDYRIIEYFTSDPMSGKMAKVLEELGGTGFFLLILVINKLPQLILTKMGDSSTGFAPEVIGVIDDIPQDLLIKEIQKQRGNLNIDRQYIVKGPTGIIMDWIKEKREKSQGNIKKEGEKLQEKKEIEADKKIFSQGEWETLKFLPFLILFSPSGANGDIDREEYSKFKERVEKGAASCKDSLCRILLFKIAYADYEEIKNYCQKAAKIKWVESHKQALEIREFLKEKLPEEEYCNFLHSLFYNIANTLKIKESARSKIVGLGEFLEYKESQLDQDILPLFAKLFKVNLKKIPSSSISRNKNTSGKGKMTVVPDEVKRWNWGAFLLHWIWGVGNKTYISLLSLIPVVTIVMMFVLGAKGSRWAWQNRKWDSIEQFQRVQRRWALGGVLLWLVNIFIIMAEISSR